MHTSDYRSAASLSTRLDTGLLPPAKRLEAWNRINTEQFSQLSVDARSDGFRGILEQRQCDSLRISCVHSTAVVVRGGQSTAWSRAGGLLLHLQVLGSSINTQLNRSTILRVGDITFCDAERPYAVRCAAPVQMIVIKIPRDVLLARLGSIDELVALHVDGTRGSGAILSSFIRSAWMHCGEIEGDGVVAGEAMMTALLDLLALVRANADTETRPRILVALHHEMRAYVEERLGDPSLSVSSLAAAFGVTPRHAHRVFAEAGTTPSRYILDRRLDFAAARLRDVQRGGSITSIALDAGFSDSLSFSRAFRNKYGAAPREYRRERSTTR